MNKRCGLSLETAHKTKLRLAGLRRKQLLVASAKQLVARTSQPAPHQVMAGGQLPRSRSGSGAPHHQIRDPKPARALIQSHRETPESWLCQAEKCRTGREARRRKYYQCPAAWPLRHAWLRSHRAPACLSSGGSRGRQQAWSHHHQRRQQSRNLPPTPASGNHGGRRALGLQRPRQLLEQRSNLRLGLCSSREKRLLQARPQGKQRQQNRSRPRRPREEAAAEGQLPGQSQKQIDVRTCRRLSTHACTAQHRCTCHT